MYTCEHNLYELEQILKMIILYWLNPYLEIILCQGKH